MPETDHGNSALFRPRFHGVVGGSQGNDPVIGHQRGDVGGGGLWTTPAPVLRSDSRSGGAPGDNQGMSSQQSLPSSGPQRADEAVKNFGRRSSGITFAVMITVLLVAIVFAANQNEIIGWIVVVISAGWLLLAAVLVFSVRRGAKKFGAAVDSARADAAARNVPQSGGTVVVDEDTQARNMKLDHSFKIVQVQKRVISQELAKGTEADMEMVDRSLDTIDTTAHNGRDMLADLVGRGTREEDESRPGPGPEDDDGSGGETIEGDVLR